MAVETHQDGAVSLQIHDLTRRTTRGSDTSRFISGDQNILTSCVKVDLSRDAVMQSTRQGSNALGVSVGTPAVSFFKQRNERRWNIGGHGKLGAHVHCSPWSHEAQGNREFSSLPDDDASDGLLAGEEEAILESLASQPETRLSLLDIHAFGKSTDAASRVAQAQFLHREVR